MVAIKAYQAANFLKTADPNISAILFYGTDVGMISEYAKDAASNYAGLEDPPGEIIRILDRDLDENPDRLAVECQTLPMFGGRKVIRTETGKRINTTTLKALLEPDKPEAILIVEAGNLKPTDALRKAFEKLPYAAAVACFPDDARDLTSLIEETLGRFKLTAHPEVIEALKTRLGADRTLSRAELEKLALYCSGRREVILEDVEAIVDDAAELALDRVINAAADGDRKRASFEFARATQSGVNPQMIILAIQRHFDRLHRLRTAVDQGRSQEDALRALRPPLHFKMKDRVKNQTRAWSAKQLTIALGTIAKAAKSARRNTPLETVIAERLLLNLSQVISAK